MAADKNITINFIPKGDDKLIKAFKDLASSQDKFNKSSSSTKKSTKSLNKSLVDMTIEVKKTGRSWKQLGIDSKTLKSAFNGSRVALDKMKVAMGKGRKRARLLDNTFATLRSQMLLFQFAMGTLGVRALGRFAKEAATVADMSRAFNNLAGGTEKASIAVDKLRSATNGTMSQFDLFQQANNAMVLGVTKNSDEMAHMFDVAQRLGAALGKDTKQSVESLITGIGRQSRLMLDNIGIIVKSEEAYESYARELGVAKDDLTDADKKQAFLNATMEAAEEKLKRVGKEVLSYNAKLMIANARMADMRVAVGDALLPVLSSLALHFTNTDNILRYARIFGGVSVALAVYHAAAIRARIATISLNIAVANSRKALIASGWGVLIVALGEVYSWMNKTKEATDDSTSSWKKQKTQISVITKNYQDLVYQKKALLQATKDEMEAFDKPSPLLPTLTDDINKIKESAKDKDKGFLNEALFGKLTPMEFSDTWSKIAIKSTDFAKTLSKVKTTPFKELTDPKIKAAESIIGSISSSLASATLNGQNMGKAVVGSLKAIAAQILSKAAIYSLASIFMPSLGLNVGMRSALKFGFGIAHTGGLINNNGSVQRFAKGGIVQGQDNVPILAQAGEFVMSRKAVEAVGVETMNRINQGGGAGTVNVTFSGNVMSQDFIENEAIPQIKEAIRRGADIGVS